MDPSHRNPFFCAVFGNSCDGESCQKPEAAHKRGFFYLGGNHEMNNGVICIRYDLVCIDCKISVISKSGPSTYSLWMFAQQAQKAGWGKRQDSKWAYPECLSAKYKPAG
jgi:hypothetical protein